MPRGLRTPLWLHWETNTMSTLGSREGDSNNYKSLLTIHTIDRYFFQHRHPLGNSNHVFPQNLSVFIPALLTDVWN